jgi:hypothetical protein
LVLVTANSLPSAVSASAAHRRLQPFDPTEQSRPRNFGEGAKPPTTAAEQQHQRRFRVAAGQDVSHTYQNEKG